MKDDMTAYGLTYERTSNGLILWRSFTAVSIYYTNNTDGGQYSKYLGAFFRRE